VTPRGLRAGWAIVTHRAVYGGKESTDND